MAVTEAVGRDGITRSEGSRRTFLGPKQTEGARLLRLARERKGWSIGLLAQQLGITTGACFRILWCDGLPDFEEASKIEDVLGIKMRLWAAAPKKEIEIIANR